MQSPQRPIKVRRNPAADILDSETHDKEGHGCSRSARVGIRRPVSTGSLRRGTGCRSALAGIASAADPLSPPVIHKIQSANDRLEMTVNSSRLLTLDQKIPRAQVNNKDIADLTPLAPNVIQIFAKKAGVTQVNLWDEHNQIYSVDVVVVGDARELNLLLQSQFPHAVDQGAAFGQ